MIKDILKGVSMAIVIALMIGIFISGVIWLIQESGKSHIKFQEKQQAEFYECLDKTERDLDWCYQVFIK